MKHRGFRKWNQLGLRHKLIRIFSITAVFILVVNVLMFYMVNVMMKRVEDVYVSNVSLNELSNTLEAVHMSMENYLNTKTSESMNEYYEDEQEYRNLIANLNRETVENEMLLMEKHIHGLSQQYLMLTNEVIAAKRGRNVERYAVLYEEADELYDAIQNFMYSLNNARFKSNSTSYQSLMSLMSNVELLCMVLLISVLMGNLVLAFISADALTRPLQKLATTAEEVSTGNFDVEPIPVRNHDEVGIVTDTFNQMVENLRNYIERLKETMERESRLMERELSMQSHLKEAQLQYLQAQINPHFLFNSLNAGTQLAMMEEAHRTEEFLENMAAFFRYNMGKNQSEVKLSDEIRLVDNYVYILNVRFSGEIHYEKDVDESLVDVSVPSMILQPLVENAVNYGIRNIDWEGHIELSVYQNEENIIISVWDNGAGMTAERIDEVLHKETPTADVRNSSSNGVGMRNVLERLRLFFDGNAQMTIISEGTNMGTEVMLTIPKDFHGERGGA